MNHDLKHGDTGATDDSIAEGVYLCDRLDLPRLFGAEMARHSGIRLYHPDDVPDPSRICFALAYKPGAGAFSIYPNLKLVQAIAAGVDAILSNDSLPPEVVVARVRDPEQARVMAGFAAWHVVWHHRGMEHYLEAEQQGAWSPIGFERLRPPSQTPVGVLGFGHMGQAIATAVSALGFPVVAASRGKGAGLSGVERVSGPGAIHEVAARARILINVLPLTEATHGILSADLFSRMPLGSALIHLGRGEHLIEADLLAALDSGQIGGASLDVFNTEPLPKAHPFWRDSRILVTPHDASVIPAESVAASLKQSLGALDMGRRPETAVNPAFGY
ncbi:NAD(P)-dependent oxidoreductase [Leisingera sp.]|uniref:NAD(P)-dependent oxidoreductase n=1 Tax=Leisingera sp. TaxID=1879318 RepID=UPI003A94419B